jgi:hypothetical protein
MARRLCNIANIRARDMTWRARTAFAAGDERQSHRADEVRHEIKHGQQDTACLSGRVWVDFKTAVMSKFEFPLMAQSGGRSNLPQSAVLP